MKKILVVDDNDHLGEILKESFVEIGYDVTVVVKGRDALKMVESVKPNVVILDMKLGDVDGLDVLEDIHKNHADIKVIIYTAFEEYKEMHSRLAKEKYCTFILKPVYVETIISEVEKLLGISTDDDKNKGTYKN